MNLKLEARSLGDLTPYERNTKRHTDEDVGFIKRSIERFGYNDPIAVTPEGVIIEGHGRYMALAQLGYDEVPVLVIEGLTEDQYDLYRIAHNKIALTSNFDFGRLFSELQELVGGGENGLCFADMGFGDRVVNDLFSHFGSNEPSTGADAGAAEAPANSTPIEYELIWDTKEDKARFGEFVQREVAGGADKSMGGEILLAAVRRTVPDIWKQICELVPGEEDNLDQIAGVTEEPEYVTV